MMRRGMFLTAGVAFACTVAILTTGCGAMSAPVLPPTGGAYTRIEAPLDLSSHGGKQLGHKVGRASSKAWFGFIALGDAGLHAAADNGGIERIYHVDYEYKNVLYGAYARYTTIVYGD